MAGPQCCHPQWGGPWNFKGAQRLPWHFRWQRHLSSRYLCQTWSVRIWGYSCFLWVSIKGVDWEVEVERGNNLSFVKRSATAASIQIEIKCSSQQVLMEEWVMWIWLPTYIFFNLFKKGDRFIFLFKRCSRLAICFTLDNIQVLMLFSRNIPPSPSPTECKSLFCSGLVHWEDPEGSGGEGGGRGDRDGEHM